MDDVIKAPDYSGYIAEKKDIFATQEENCSNCYTNIRQLLNNIESENPEFDIAEFSDYMQILEEYYAYFALMQEVLDSFASLNDDAQKLNTTVEDFQKTIYDFEMHTEALTQDMNFKDQRIAKLEEEMHILSNDYFTLYSSNAKEVVLKDEDIEMSEREKEERALLTTKVNKLKEENRALKQAKASLAQMMELHENDLRTKYIFKPEHERIVKDIKKEMKEYREKAEESEVIIMNLRKDIEFHQVTKDKMNNDLQNKEMELERLRQECEEMKLHKGYRKLPTINLNSIVYENKEDEFYSPLFIGQNETPQHQKNQQNQNTITLKDTLIERNEGSERSIIDNKENNEDENCKKYHRTCTEIVNSMAKNDFNRVKEIEEEKNKAMMIEAEKQKEKEKEKEKQKEKEKEKGSSIKSAYQIIRPQMTRYQNNNQQDDYYKQFFFLTYQAMKLNSDVIDPFITFNPEKLYKECKSERVPFHKYYKWLKKRINTFIEEHCTSSGNFYDNIVSFLSGKLI